ncbi:hypothetical protein [Actinomadura sp. 3N407]|uniref:hypothetical protein n=1 Tax=Actinomadura sp. 3N407 TaxID=3457423 RepID=UPI003FCD258C
MTEHIPMTPVPYEKKTTTGEFLPVVAYTTVTPGLLIAPNVNPLDLTAHLDEDADGAFTARFTYGSQWEVMHRDGHLIAGGMWNGVTSYPQALALARELGAAAEWTATGDELAALPAERRKDLGRIINVAHRALTRQWADGVAEVTALVGPVIGCWMPPKMKGAKAEPYIPHEAEKRVALVMADGWTSGALAARLTHRLRATNPRAAVLARLRRLPYPAPIGDRPEWCGACDPGTRLVTRRGPTGRDGDLIRCRSCHSHTGANTTPDNARAARNAGGPR